MDPITPGNGGSSSASSARDNASERLQRAQELAEERLANGRLSTKILQLEDQVTRLDRKRERSNTIRFLILCTVVLLGLGAVVYLQIDSRGSGQLRRDLIAQCEVRNANTVAMRQSLGDAGVADDDVDVQNFLLKAAGSLQTYDCAELR